MKDMKWEEAKKEINNGLVFLEFSTPWCSDCAMMKPIIAEVEEKIKSEHNLEINFINVDAEEANFFRKEDAEFEVLKIPSFYIIKNGEKKHIGYKYMPVELVIKSIIEFIK